VGKPVEFKEVTKRGSLQMVFSQPRGTDPLASKSALRSRALTPAPPEARRVRRQRHSRPSCRGTFLATRSSGPAAELRKRSERHRLAQVAGSAGTTAWLLASGENVNGTGHLLGDYVLDQVMHRVEVGPTVLRFPSVSAFQRGHIRVSALRDARWLLRYSREHDLEISRRIMR
jgi:hypothetical protein